MGERYVETWVYEYGVLVFERREVLMPLRWCMGLDIRYIVQIEGKIVHERITRNT